MQLNINILKNALQQPLPGEKIQLQMAPSTRPIINSTHLKITDYKQSAVMVVLCVDETNNFFIPLIERETYNGTHSGQISLPGGKFDLEDLDLETTAKRECFEEIGLTSIEVLGKLTSVYIPVSGFLVQPYLGYFEVKNPNFVKHEREVKSILNLSIEELLDDNIVKNGSVTLDLSINHPYFEMKEYKIWGATAMILNEVKAVLKEVSHFE
ncbi:MAG: CoA pyrophosphatase [Bacteroidota bacterium]|nr:CoA pyrophosphatase [Bacteroidota bacterium]